MFMERSYNCIDIWYMFSLYWDKKNDINILGISFMMSFILDKYSLNAERKQQSRNVLIKHSNNITPKQEQQQRVTERESVRFIKK